MILNNINLLTLNFFKLEASKTPNMLNQIETVELLNGYFVTASLTVLVILSLFLTFYKKGTAVHKVLGLLLVSVFVVFLWMYETQFLFIYLVYILAFISAVLMLFLSVVLMLPISTLTQKTLKLGNLLVVFLLIIVNFVSWENKNKIKYVSNFKNYLVFLCALFYVLCLKLWKNSNIYFRRILTKSSITKVLNYSIVELLVQIYLFVNVLGIAINLHFSSHYFSNILNQETTSGLGLLKNMLYSTAGSFLIISTMVLLVALIGAAIMTKNDKLEN
jgi:hypothetical protein